MSKADRDADMLLEGYGFDIRVCDYGYGFVPYMCVACGAVLSWY